MNNVINVKNMFKMTTEITVAGRAKTRGGGKDGEFYKMTTRKRGRKSKRIFEKNRGSSLLNPSLLGKRAAAENDFVMKTSSMQINASTSSSKSDVLVVEC